jgi:hypothetical protein
MLFFSVTVGKIAGHVRYRLIMKVIVPLGNSVGNVLLFSLAYIRQLPNTFRLLVAPRHYRSGLVGSLVVEFGSERISLR